MSTRSSLCEGPEEENLFCVSLLVPSVFLGVFDIPWLIKTSANFSLCLRETMVTQDDEKLTVLQDDLPLPNYF